ncbi:MAG: hypothetical protein AAB554_01440 [Patescibacteria group bacterium]
MEEALEDLHGLIWEAARGFKSDCLITTRAYLALAEKAARRLSDHAVDEDEEKRVRAACDFSERFCRRQKKWEVVLSFLVKFWSGFEDGFFERTHPIDAAKHYELGYELGRYGLNKWGRHGR